MAELEHQAKPIKVRLEWTGGRMQTLDETIDGTRLEWIQNDEAGKAHRFEDSGVVDGEGYHVFVESN